MLNDELVNLLRTSDLILIGYLLVSIGYLLISDGTITMVSIVLYCGASPLVIIPVHASHVSCHPDRKIFKTWIFDKQMFNFQSCNHRDCMTVYLGNLVVFIVIVTEHIRPSWWINLLMNWLLLPAQQIWISFILTFPDPPTKAGT